MADIICFHNPDEENGFLSNWYLSDFDLYGIRYTSMEQYMMYQKAMAFSDMRAAELILATNNVAEIKALGRSVKNYNDTIWNGLRQVIVYKGLVAKFSASIEMCDNLIKTGDAILAECAVKDRIWGIGLSMTDPRRYDMSQWRGQNLLGFALMAARETLR